MKVVGFILITLGMLFMFAGMTMDTTANYSDTLNIGLLNDQTNRILIGGFLFVSGIASLVGGNLIEKIGDG